MAIQNVNALVDKYSLSYLQNSNYINKYYNEALANLGQRNTEELLLKYNSFTLRQLFTEFQEFLLNESDSIDNYKYLIITIDEHYQNVLKSFELYGIENGDSNSFNITTQLSNINDNTNEQILFNRKFDIIRKLAASLVKGTDKDIDDQGISEHKMYVPLDYEITYVCNGINEMILYYGRNDLYVYIIPMMDNDQEYVFKYEDVIFIRHLHNYLKTVVYNYNFYRDENSLKYEVNVYRKFILPYIDEDNIWQVNKVDTGICAQGKDAIELNIITVYQNFEGATAKLDILSGLSKITEINGTIAYPNVFIKNGTSSFKINCYLPNIQIIDRISNNIDIKDIVKNSTIILICPINYFLNENNYDNNEIIEQYGKDGLITTIWTYKDDDINGGWEYLSVEQDSQGNRLALDLNRLTNFDALIEYKLSKLNQIHPDNFLYRHLIFENSINPTKHHTGNISTIYGVIQNLKGNEYNDVYINNLNLSFRYLNHLVGKPNKDISEISNNTSKYLKFFSAENSNYITNSLYYTKKNNQTNYWNEFIPNYNVPTLDLSEVLIKDSNVMNKQNVLSFDNTGAIYYSYFGTSFEDIDKSTIRLGTSQTNVNIGNKTLVNDYNKSKFKVNTKLSIDFPDVVINGNTTIKDHLDLNKNMDISGVIWNNKQLDESTEIIHSQIVPMFKYIYNKSNSNQYSTIYNIININNISNELRNLHEMYKNHYNEDDPIYLYFNIILSQQVGSLNSNYYYKYNDLLYIPALIKKVYKTLHKKDDDISTYNITSDTNQIIKIGDQSVFLVSSDNKLSSNIIIQSSSSASENSSINIINKISNIFFGCPLDVIIDKSLKRIIINEHKSHKLGSIWKLPTNISASAV